ncbi:MAG: hypothetical protein Q8Q96_00180, partial [bacterium]|nr:hypothetical protein [bacterium]
FSSLFSKLPSYKMFLYPKMSLTHPKKMFLTISVIIAVLLLASIFFAVKKREDAKNQAVLTATISQAQKKYDEGQALLGLNKNFARDDFLAAQKVLTEGQTKFKKGSREEKQISELLLKTSEAISASSNLFLVEAKPSEREAHSLFAASDDKNIYLIDNEGIFSIDKKTKAKKLIIKKGSQWNETGGFGIYFGSFYVLDKRAGQIFKFVPTEGGFSKTNYLASGVSLDFSKAVNLSIDGSVWVLLNDGTIVKFTKGKIENFTLSGLDKPLSSPSRIFTNADTDKLYLLDKGNSRIVVTGKDGAYQAQYQTDILKNAIELEVSDKDKKIFVLSQEKIWEISY